MLDQTNEAGLGYVLAVEHLVDIRILAKPSTPHGRILDSLVKKHLERARGRHMTVTQYIVGGREACLVSDDSDDAFLKAEPLTEGFALVWSCELDVRSAIRRLGDELPTADGEAYVVSAEGPRGFVTLAEALQIIQESPSDLLAVRLEWKSFTLVWEREDRRPGETQALEVGRMALLADDFDPAFCARIVERTANLSIAVNVDEAFDSLRAVTDTLTRGQLP